MGGHKGQRANPGLLITCAHMAVAALAIVLLADKGGIHAALLPAPMEAWHGPASGVFSGRVRYWNQSILDKGIYNLGNLAYFKQFFAKLNSGKRIVAVAFGSSFVHDFAGCWQTSLQALWDLGIVPNPMLYPQQGAHVKLDKWDYVGTKCAKGGYMDGVMDTINATWPSSGHIFVNNGKGGACLSQIVEASCMSSFTPEEVDLLLLDTVTNPCAEHEMAAEKIIRRFMRLKSQPLIFLVSNARNCQAGGAEASNRCADCLRKHKGSRTAAECSDVPEPYSAEDNNNFNVRVIEPFYPLTRHYDVPHINLYDLMNAVMRSGEAERTGLTRLELLGRLYADWVHFNKNDSGTLLAADMLVHWLVRGQQALEALTDAQRAALSYRLPAKPLYPAALLQYTTRCYGMTIKGALELIKAGRAGNVQAETLQQLETAMPGDTFEFVQVGHNPAQSLPPLNVTSNEGWELQLYYKGARGDMKLKPGWVTSKPGAALSFVVNSAFEGQPADQPVELLFHYTRSYDGWGRARLCCSAQHTCKCGCAEMDAHQAGEKTSLKMVLHVNVTQHPECTLRLEVLAETSSGGHKFKVSSVMVRAPDAQPAADPAAPAVAAAASSAGGVLGGGSTQSTAAVAAGPAASSGAAAAGGATAPAGASGAASAALSIGGNITVDALRLMVREIVREELAAVFAKNG